MQLKTKFKRAMSGLLAAIMVVGLIPSGIILASAADDMPNHVTMKGDTITGTYTSSTLEPSKIYVRTNMQMVVNGEDAKNHQGGAPYGASQLPCR